MEIMYSILGEIKDCFLWTNLFIIIIIIIIIIITIIIIIIITVAS